jgi:hypothetical protein
MRKNVFLLCLVAVAMMLPAVTVAQNNDIKLWSDGLLTWSDFTGVTIVKDVPSYMKVELTTTSKTINADGKTKVSLTANAVMHRNLSYADTAKCDAQRLRYHQLQFDMLEYFRRRLQNDINTGINEYETTQRIKKYEELYTERVKEMDVATTNGADEHKLQDWEYLVRRQLEDMGVPNVPEVSQGGFVYGIYGGVGAVFPTSELKDNFDGCAIFMIGLTGGYDRLRLKADIAFRSAVVQQQQYFQRQGYSRSSVTGQFALLCHLSRYRHDARLQYLRFRPFLHHAQHWRLLEQLQLGRQQS